MTSTNDHSLTASYTLRTLRTGRVETVMVVTDRNGRVIDTVTGSDRSKIARQDYSVVGLVNGAIFFKSRDEATMGRNAQVKRYVAANPGMLEIVPISGTVEVEVRPTVDSTIAALAAPVEAPVEAAPVEAPVERYNDATGTWEVEAAPVEAGEPLASSYSATIYSSSLTTVRAAFDKMARKAERFGCDAPTLVASEPYTQNRRTELGYRYDVVLCDVTVTMPGTIVVDGGTWQLLAAIDIMSGEGDNIVRSYAVDLPAWFRTVEGSRCDHCNAARRRAYLVALADPNGEIRIVGRSCARDYIGVDLKAMLSWHESLVGAIVDAEVGEDDEDWSDLQSGRFGLSTFTWIHAAAMSIDVRGYHTSASEYPTKDAAWKMMGRDGRELYDAADITNPIDAAAAMAWAQTQDDGSDFSHNMRSIASCPNIDVARHGGIAAYIPEGYRRHLDRQAEQAVRDAARSAGEADRHTAPTLGKGSDVAGTVVGLKHVEGYYATVYRMTVRVETNRGHYLACGTVPVALERQGVRRGDRVRFTVASMAPASWASDGLMGEFKRPTKAEIVERAE